MAATTHAAGPVDRTAAADGATGRQQEPTADARRGHWVWAGLVVLWLAGLAAGFVAGLTVAARAGCSGSGGGFGCGNGGSAVGALLVLIVIGTVGAATVYAYDARSSTRTWLRYLGAALLVLAVVVVAARLVVATL